MLMGVRGILLIGVRGIWLIGVRGIWLINGANGSEMVIEKHADAHVRPRAFLLPSPIR